MAALGNPHSGLLKKCEHQGSKGWAFIGSILVILLISEELILVSKNKNQVDSLICLGSITSEEGWCNEDVKSGITKEQDVFSHLKKVWKNKKISLPIKIRVSEATVMTVIKHVFEACALRKTEEDLLDISR